MSIFEHILTFIATAGLTVYGVIRMLAGSMGDTSESARYSNIGFYIAVAGAVLFLANLVFWIF